MRMTLDELINAMEPQARKDKALISKCVDGLTEYAAELRQKAGDAGKEQISALRRLVDELAGYVALCGTSEHAMLWMLEQNPQIRKVALCLDHDEAGIEASGQHEDMEVTSSPIFWKRSISGASLHTGSSGITTTTGSSMTDISSSGSRFPD